MSVSAAFSPHTAGATDALQSIDSLHLPRPARGRVRPGRLAARCSAGAAGFDMDAHLRRHSGDAGRRHLAAHEPSGGHVVVELVSDATSATTQIGEVESNDDMYSFFKPANYGMRLTAVPTGSGCTFRRWVLSTAGTPSTTVGTNYNPLHIDDDFRPFSNTRAEFLC